HLGYAGLSSLAFIKKNWDDAIGLQKLAWNYSEKDLDKESEVYNFLSKAYYEKKNYKDALDNYRHFVLIRDSFANNDRLKKADELEAKYQNKEKQLQINLLNEEKKNRGQERNLAYVVGGAAIILLSGAFISFRQRQRLKLLREKDDSQKKMQTVRDKIAQDLHDDIGATLSSISMYSQAVKQKIDGDTETKDMINLIGEDAREMVGNMSDIVWAINPVNDTTEKLFDRMRNYAAPLLSSKNMKIDFSICTEITEMNFTMEERQNIYLIFKEAINNAVKYSEAKNVTILFSSNQNNFEMKIKDDGKGFDLKEYDGNGLKNMTKRASTIRGTLKIISSPANGTEIHLSVLI
ncbi:MAG: histidine kinase, partial [Bacteroidota bacterium]